MAGIGAIMGLVSAGVGLAGSMAQAKFMQAQAQNERVQLGQMAAQERAAASREASAKSKEGRIAQSRLQSVSAASGGGATDPTVLDLAGDISKEANVQSREIMRQGLEKGQMLEYKGRVGVDMAKAQSRMTILGGVGNMIGGVAESLGGVGDAFSKYGRGMPIGSTQYADNSQSSVPAWYYNYS